MTDWVISGPDNGPWPADDTLTSDRRFLHDAFDQHIRDSHGADFEVCPNPYCQSAYQIEQRLRAEGVFPFADEVG